MDVSLIYEVSTPVPRDQEIVRAKFHEAVAQIELADRLGYRTVWATEHHFAPWWAHTSAPEMLLAYLAGRTERIRLGSAITLLPHAINHPARVAERVATLDVLSNGRAEFGGGRALSVADLEAFGIDPDDSKAQWEEALEFIPQLWTEDFASFDGKFLKFPLRELTPRPVQDPHPPMWTACTQPTTMEFAGKHGLGALAFGVGYEAIKELVDLYRKAQATKDVEPFGKVRNNRFACWVHCLCAPTDEEAIAIQGRNYLRYVETAGELWKPWKGGKAPRSYEYFVNMMDEYEQDDTEVSMEEVVAGGSAAIGSPETVREVLTTLEAQGVDEVLLFMQNYDAPEEAVTRSIELVAQEVMPHLQTTVPTPA